MKNLILYSDRYQAVRLIDDHSVKFEILIYSQSSDLDFYIVNEIVRKFFFDEKYDNIFIPLAPFGSYTDQVGLRIAMYLKFCQSESKLSNIFIYGVSNLSELLNNECFDIIKFSEVNLMAYSNKEFEINLKNNSIINEEEWFHQINNLSLKIPDDYFDDHSIANEWGIFQIARNAGIEINDIEGFNQSKFNKLYFKWLIAKNSLFDSVSAEQIEKQKSYADKLPKIKVLGKIELPPTKRRRG
ncbi:hypothetical protein JOE44_000374 [Chryseobacterium sp. PvR013]|uniref:hypothetical protein n=1 Tax=Chryseobacterium sp. PvR013 TaxID=2806595 RepID=UPI001AE77656|nr:hypothetical protein [Chryseobacterium sp. PvR013]MBP1163490.1 hypothetical protein [Chryseobacterium sp. PvR013]